MRRPPSHRTSCTSHTSQCGAAFACPCPSRTCAVERQADMVVGARSMRMETTTSPAPARVCCLDADSSWRGRGSRSLARQSVLRVGSCRSSGGRAPQRRTSVPTTVAASTSLCIRGNEQWRGLELRCNARLPSHSDWSARPRGRRSGGGRACYGTQAQGRTVPGADARGASAAGCPRC